MTRLRAAALGLLAFSLSLPALPAGAAVAAKTQTVHVDAVEYSFALSPKTARRGTITFVVVNLGQRPHDFKIAGRRTPLIAPGETAKLTVTFAKPGSYAYFCTVAGHAVAGMKGVLKVT